MKTKYKIDPEKLDITDCKRDFKCLYENFPTCGEILKGVEGVVCTKNSGDCKYKCGTSVNNSICLCFVRREIYLRHKK